MDIAQYENTSPEIARSQAVPQDQFDLFSSSPLDNHGFDGDSVGGGPATEREESGWPQWMGSDGAGSDCGTASYRGSSVLPETTIQGALTTLLSGQLLSGTVLDHMGRMFEMMASAEAPIRVYSNAAQLSELRNLAPSIVSAFAFIHDSSHWTLGQLDLKEHKLFYFDSMSARITESLARGEERWNQFAHRLYPGSETWDSSHPPCAQQSNSWDCGIHVFVTLIYRFCQLELPQTCDCDLWRHLLAVLLSSEDPQQIPFQLRYWEPREILNTSPLARPGADNAKNAASAGANSYFADYMDHVTGRVQDTKRRLDIRQRNIRTLRQTSNILTALEGKCDARVQFEDPTVGERELARIERWMEEATSFTFAQELPAQLERAHRNTTSAIEIMRGKRKQLKQYQAAIARARASVENAFQSLSDECDRLRQELVGITARLREESNILSEIADAIINN